MLRVGITGGIGSGKTALTDWLATQGIVIVDADLAEFVDEHCGLEPLLIGQDVVQECGFTGSQKSRQDGYGDRFMAVSRGQGPRERFSHQFGV